MNMTTTHAGWTGLLRLISLMVTGVLLVVTAGLAHAQERRFRGDGCGAGACGSANFNFIGRNELTDVNLDVSDTKCDQNDVYIKIRIYDTKGQRDVLKKRNSRGCNSRASWQRQYALNARALIRGVRVFVCVDDFGSDTCFSSSYIDNPNT